MLDPASRNLCDIARQIFLDSLRRLDISSTIRTKVGVQDGALEVGDARLELSRYREIVLVGLGKASVTMGAAVESLLGDRFSRGILVTDRYHKSEVRSRVVVGGHPLPNSNSIEAASAIIGLVTSCSQDTLIIFLVSGGGSALVELPISPDISLEDLRELNESLIKCGASIREINTIRKHLSAVKGGRLGFLARASDSVGLFVSDVNVGDLRSIASNPLLPDESTVADVEKVIQKYSLGRKLPRSIAALVEQHKVPNLPGDWRISSPAATVNLLLLDNTDVMKSAADSAMRRGFRVEVDSRYSEGNYKEVAEELITRLMDLRRGFPGDRVCLISGGEVSCAVAGAGVGGRNQEFVLYSAARLAQLDRGLAAVVLSCGTDGIDGNSHSAGAIAYAGLETDAAARGLEISTFIQGSDSHSFLKQTGGLIFTGPTGNNVRDLRIMLAGAGEPSC